MNSKIKIKGVALIGDSSIPCMGEIEILNFSPEHRTAYAWWRIFDTDGKLLAAKSRNYFIDKDTLVESDIIELALKNITNYRMGRKRVFSEVEIIGENHDSG